MGPDIIIGEDTRSAAGDAIIVRRLDRVAGYGGTGGLAIYELLRMAADVGGTEAPEWVRTYESGLSAYEDRRWSKAIICLKRRPLFAMVMTGLRGSWLSDVTPASPIRP